MQVEQLKLSEDPLRLSNSEVSSTRLGDIDILIELSRMSSYSNHRGGWGIIGPTQDKLTEC